MAASSRCKQTVALVGQATRSGAFRAMPDRPSRPHRGLGRRYPGARIGLDISGPLWDEADYRGGGYRSGSAATVMQGCAGRCVWARRGIRCGLLGADLDESCGTKPQVRPSGASGTRTRNLRIKHDHPIPGLFCLRRLTRIRVWLRSFRWCPGSAIGRFIGSHMAAGARAKIRVSAEGPVFGYDRHALSPASVLLSARPSVMRTDICVSGRVIQAACRTISHRRTNDDRFGDP